MRHDKYPKRPMLLMPIVAAAIVFMAVATGDPVAQADTFGSGANAFEIEFVTIGDLGNVADIAGTPDPAGSVPYAYRMGKFEISARMIDKANALGGLGITKSLSSTGFRIVRIPEPNTKILLASWPFRNLVLTRRIGAPRVHCTYV